MSFSSVKGLSLPAISQHLKIQRGTLTIRCAYHSQRTQMHLFLLLLQTFVNSENLSYGFRNNLLCTTFFFSHASTGSVNAAILSTLFCKYLFTCLPPPLEGERLRAVGSGLYFSWVPSTQHLVRDLHILVNVGWVNGILTEPWGIGDCVPHGSHMRDNWRSLAVSSELS